MTCFLEGWCDAQLLYTSRDRAIQQTANTWLQDFQKQPEGWQVAAQLLQETNNTYVFFGAHTLCKWAYSAAIMRSKIRYDLNELSTEQIQQLFSMLFAVARQYKDSRSTVRNEICLDIASLLLRWNGIHDIVNVAVANIGESGNDYMLLNILSMLPVEVSSTRVFSISLS